MAQFATTNGQIVQKLVWFGSRLSKASSFRVAVKAGLIFSFSLVLHADCSLAELSRTNMLVIPGAGNATSLKTHPYILAWVRQIHQTTTWTTSVCED